MPEIKMYNQQVNPAGPANVQRATAEDYGGGIGQAMYQMGQNASDTGLILQKREQQKDVSDLDAKMAQAQDKLNQNLLDQKQKGTLNHDTFMDSVNDEMDNIAQNIGTNVGSMRFKEMAARTKLTFSQEAQKGQAELAGAQAVQDVKMANDARTSLVYSNPGLFDQTLKDQTQAIDDKVALHGLPADRAPELKRELTDRMAVGAVRGLMNADPDEAQKQMASGKWDPYMGENSKYKMQEEIERAKRGRLMDQERAQKLKDQAASAVQEATGKSFLAQIYDPNGPGLSSKDVLGAMQANKIDSTTAEHFFRLIDSNNQDKKLKSDPYVFNDLTRRLALPDGDPQKITDANEINKHLGRDVSIPDANLLYGLLGEKHTPQGDADAAVQKTYFDTLRGQTVKKNPLGMEDPDGLKIYQDVQAQSYQYSLTAMKNGKSKAQIWSPTLGGKANPDFVGNHVSVPQRSMQDIMKSQIDFMKRGQPPPGTTEMSFPDGTTQYIPNANVQKAKDKYKATEKAKK